MEYSDRNNLQAILSQELLYIARQAVSSDKVRVEDKIASEIMKHMSRKGFTYRNGTPKAELLKYIVDCPINLFAQIVDGSTSVDQFKMSISDLMDDSYRRKTWKKIEHSFGIQWKFKFPFPKNLYDSKVNSRTWKHKTKMSEPKSSPPPADPLTLLPDDIKELLRKMSNASEFQIKIIKGVLNNPIGPDVKGIRIQIEKNIWISYQIE